MMRITKLISVAVVSLGFTLVAVPQASAQSVDVGFTIPTQEEVQRARDNRRNQALGERQARAVMDAFELYEEGDIMGAISVLQGINARSDYDRAYVARFLGTMYASLEDDQAQPQRAIEHLEAAVRPDLLSWSDQRQSLQLLANLYLMVEQYQDALTKFREYLQFTGEWDPDVLVRMASANMELQNYSDVIPFARKAIEHYDEPNRNPYVLQIAAFYEAGEIAEAVKVLEAGIQVLPGEEGWWSQLGMFYMLEEDYEKALATMSVAYQAGFLDRSSHYRALSQLYSNNGVPFHSGEIMKRYIDNGEIEETSSNWANAARAYRNAREFARAAEAFAKAAEVAEPGDDLAGYYRQQGSALLQAERYRDAAAPLQRAIDALPSGEDAGNLYMSLAEAYFYSNQYRQAHRAAIRATEYSSTRRNASSWAEFIKSTAERRGVDI